MNNVHTEDHNGYRIRIIQDDTPENPLEAWDCISEDIQHVIKHNGGQTIESLEFDCPELTKEQIKNNSQELKNLCSRYSSNGPHKKWSLLAALESCSKHYKTNFNNVTDYVNDTIDIIWENSDHVERLIILQMAGYKTLEGCKNGYCQGHSFDYYAFSKNDIPEDTFDEYAAYCFGDVYGFVIDLIDDEGDIVDEDIESCWGFYGAHDSPTWDYMINSAKETIDELPATVAA